MRRMLLIAIVTVLVLLTFVVTASMQERRNNKGREAGKRDSNSVKEELDEADDPDLPKFNQNFDKGEYLRQRDEQMNFLRGLPYPDADVRTQAIYSMMRQEIAQKARLTSPQALAALPLWRFIGPAPIGGGTSFSGRVSAIAVHPTNPNIAYVGTAQGGLYRTLDSGLTWTPMLDSALSLAIGSVAIAPSDPTIVFVGTGEPNNSLDSFFGVGIYRITNADTTPVLAGPLRLDGVGADIFTGRAVSQVIIHPTDPNILFASTARGVGGISGSQQTTLPTLGVYRTTNALAASPVFTKLTVTTANGGNREITDISMEPGNPARLLAYVNGLAAVGDGGSYISSNALDASPTFTQTYVSVTASTRGRYAVNNVGGTVTAVVATGDTNGKVLKSTDGGSTWPTTLTAGAGYCNPQCFYDLTIAINPVDAMKIYLGGSPAAVFKRSLDGGTTFTSSAAGLHVDSHAIAIAPSNPDIIYFGSDGGIWVSFNGGTSWNNRNVAGFSATQFQGLSLHPTDRYYMIGGTQDNGTEYLLPGGTGWIRSDGGDGGMSVIDQTATDTVNVTAYHTYFNSTGSQIGFARATTTDVNGDPNWDAFLGCGSFTANGITCTDATLFYAPMTRGPGTPNTLYFGTDRLYRSSNKGTTMVPVSQQPVIAGIRLSAIGIAPQDDNVRIVGTTNGRVFATTTGLTTLTEITGPIPARYVARIVVDPLNANTAYVTLSGFGLAAGQHVWKTTTLNGAATWTAAGVGIPDVPVSAFAIDPTNSSKLYAGTDIGVYRSLDGGTSWEPFSNGLPRVAVFDMAIHPIFGFLRIATHGRGIWEINLRANAVRADFDGDGKTDVSVFRPAGGFWYISNSSDSVFRTQQFGASGDRIAPGDYDGDGKADTAVFRAGTWFILNSSDNGFRSVPFGLAGDVPVAADYDGDGKADIAVFRLGNWYRLNSSDGSFQAAAWGVSTDLAVPSDYDGDGKADLAVFRGSDGSWNILQSATNTFRGQGFGLTGDRPVAADYDGDGKADLAVFRPSNGTWYELRSNSGFYAAQFGALGDTPVQGDYDGDGKSDIAVWRGSEGNWYMTLSANNAFRAQQFGLLNDVPVPAGFNP